MSMHTSRRWALGGRERAPSWARAAYRGRRRSCRHDRSAARGGDPRAPYHAMPGRTPSPPRSGADGHDRLPPDAPASGGARSQQEPWRTRSNPRGRAERCGVPARWRQAPWPKAGSHEHLLKAPPQLEDGWSDRPRRNTGSAARFGRHQPATSAADCRTGQPGSCRCRSQVISSRRSRQRPADAGGRRRRGRRSHNTPAIADAQRTEDENPGGHPRLPQHDRLLDIRACEHGRARFLQRQGHSGRTVSVGVGLDDGDDARRRLAPPCQERPDVLEVGLQGPEVDVGERAAGHDARPGRGITSVGRGCRTASPASGTPA